MAQDQARGRRYGERHRKHKERGAMRFPDTEICYECGEPFFDLEKMGDQWLCVLCRYHFENEGCPYEGVANVTDKGLDTD